MPVSTLVKIKYNRSGYAKDPPVLSTSDWVRRSTVLPRLFHLKSTLSAWKKDLLQGPDYRQSWDKDTSCRSWEHLCCQEQRLLRECSWRTQEPSRNQRPWRDGSCERWHRNWNFHKTEPHCLPSCCRSSRLATTWGTSSSSSSGRNS